VQNRAPVITGSSLMIEDIRRQLNYNYRMTSQRFRETYVNAERFNTPQVLYDSAERNIGALEDLISIIRELKKERKYGIVDSYTDNNMIVKVEVKAELYMREIKDKGLQVIELDPSFLRKAREIFDIYDQELQRNN